MYIFMYLCILCIMVAFKQPRVFYGKTNICGNCNIKQKYYMQGEGEGGGGGGADPNIWANFT